METSDWSNPALEPLFLALASLIEFGFVLGAAVFCRTHHREIRESLCRCIQRISAWLRRAGKPLQDDSKYTKLLKDDVTRVQLRMSHTFLKVLAIIGNCTTLIYQSNIWRHRQRWMPTEFILFMLPISAFATLHLFCPTMAVSRRSVNFCYAGGMTCGILALSSLGSPPLDSSTLSLSLAYTAFFRLPSVTLATNTSLVVVFNGFSFLMLWLRAFMEGFPNNLNAGTSLWVEGLSCLVVTLVSMSLKQGLRGAATQRLHNKKVTAELSAATSLLRLTCDAVIELGEDLRLTSHSPELAAVLLRDRPGVSLEGLHLTDFMPTAEAARARELLVSNTAGTTGDLVDDGGKISANVFHTRLVDIYSSRFRTEVFQVCYSKIDGEVRHLIGLRDFTDQLSLAGRNATDQIREPQAEHVDGANPVGSNPPSERTDQLILELDLQDMLVNSASASIRSLVGQRLEEVFTPDGVELFRKARLHLLALEEQKTLHEKTLFFGSLGLRCGNVVYPISGIMEPTWSRRRELGLVLCFRMSPAGPMLPAATVAPHHIAL